MNAFQKDIEDRYQNLYQGSPEETSAFKEEHDSSPLSISRDSPNLNPLKGHPPLSHSTSVPSEFVLAETQHDLLHLEHNKSDRRSFAESLPSPYLGPSHSVYVSQPDQDIDKTYALDRSDEIHDSMSVDQDNMRKSQPLINVKRGKGDSVNSATVPESSRASFLDTIGRNESMDINDKVVVDKVDAKANKKEEKKKKKEKEKEDKRKHIEEAAMSRRRARGVSGVKEIPNFSGIM